MADLSTRAPLMGGSSPRETFKTLQETSPEKGLWFLYSERDQPIIAGNATGDGELYVVSAVADADAPARREEAWNVRNFSCFKFVAPLIRTREHAVQHFISNCPFNDPPTSLVNTHAGATPLR